MVISSPLYDTARLETLEFFLGKISIIESLPTFAQP